MAKAKKKKGSARVARAGASIGGRSLPVSLVRAPAPQTIVIQRGSSGRVGRRRGGGSLARITGTNPFAIVKYMGGLGGGGAIGSILQSSLQEMGIGPILSKFLTALGSWMLGRGASPGSLSHLMSQGSIASAGSGFIFDLVQWWKSRKSNLVDQINALSPEQRAEVLKAFAATQTPQQAGSSPAPTR